MYTAAKIRRHINYFIDDKPFSIRDFLHYGSRTAVDQVFFRLVKSAEIVRVTRGVFIKCTAPMPSVLEVATAKAAAFRKEIAIHGLEAACELKLVSETLREPMYASSGRTTSFRFGDVRVHFVGVSSRKMYLKNTTAGLAIRALWHLGKTVCDAKIVSRALIQFNRLDRQTLRESAHAMPSWMCELISFMGR